MCVADVIHYMCSICNTRLGKPRRRVLEHCSAVILNSKNRQHCGVLYDTVPEPSAADPALNHSGLEFEVLKTALGYTLIEPQHRRPKPKAIRCDLCVDHLGEKEAEVREKWWRAETKALAGTRKNKRLIPGPSTAGWSDIYR
ncbi:uncharacterized protein CLUP02_18320 [Colletotrichum lupini]|uniref:Uncharacterized protein n=1 Tax=Colletotrichum lupini TaxID=145971 RepID=A0A9Q8WBS0_9PEZI|nr:uncharacterized protein CLUP02_18320 [Colletotrichum lupini]KAK1707791.1 hypothetical protein BDP67DRAFT_411826 [Colletotrichum lupini]UQC76805.1 hypothetical protein CLUP02_18320 [Colletotrichum lupini]